jgi:hypothetical protein
VNARGARLVAVVAAATALVGCTQVVRYSDELVDERYGRTPFTRVPATLGGTVGFVAGVPVDVAAFPVTFAYYHAQPKETRDVLSTFLFPSFVLWKVGILIGAPFDAIEWAGYRRWRAAPPMTQEQRDAIERAWDAKEYTEYPVRSVYPASTDGA